MAMPEAGQHDRVQHPAADDAGQRADLVTEGAEQVLGGEHPTDEEDQHRQQGEREEAERAGPRAWRAT